MTRRTLTASLIGLALLATACASGTNGTAARGGDI